MTKLTLAALTLSALAPFQAFADLTIARSSAPGIGAAGSQAISADGNSLAFSSAASTLVASDGNGVADIFVRNLTSSAIECVSKSNAGAFGNAASINPSISADGRYVAFQSTASNLVSGDTNAAGNGTGLDIFVYDRTTSTIKRVSVTAAGAQAGLDSATPSISGDGAFVAFASNDPNLAGAASGALSYIYIVNRATGSIVRVPLPSTPSRANQRGCYNPSISRDGNFVAYEFDVAEDIPAIVAYGFRDIYVYNRTTNQNIRITGSPDTDDTGWNGMQSSNPSISGDGAQIAFESNVRLTPEKVEAGSNFNDIFIARLGLTTTYRLASKDALGALGDAHSSVPAFSDNGRFVTFQSGAGSFSKGATNGQPHIYRKELASGQLSLVAAAENNNASFASAIAGNGSRVSFLSNATNVIPAEADTNPNTDVFVATFPASLGFDENGSATPIVDITGSYSGGFPNTGNPYEADVAMDESGKVVVMGTVDGYTHPTRGPQVRANGKVKTVNNTPTVSGSSSIKGGTLDGTPMGGEGKVSLPLTETDTPNGPELQDGVASGKGTKDGVRFTQAKMLVTVPSQSENATKDWSLTLNIVEGTTATGKTIFTASAILYLPNGEQTEFKERKLTRNPKTGLYATTFEKGTKLDEALEPILRNDKKVIDRKSRITINQLEVPSSGDPRQPTAGQLRYKFLGQKGSGDLLDFL